LETWTELKNLPNGSMKSEKWLIVGGAGYIGSHVALEYEKHAAEVYVIDDLSTGLQRRISKPEKFFKVDVRNTSEIVSILNGYEIDGIVHLAGMRQARESLSIPTEYWDRNVGGTTSLAKAVLSSSVRKVVFSSSCSVYGNLGKVDVNSTLNPVSPYGRTKLVGEQILKDLMLEKEMSIGILRYFNVIGANEDAPFFDETAGALLPKIIPAALRDETIWINGDDFETHDGTAIRDFIDVRDLARAHVLVSENLYDTKQPHYFNVSSGNPQSVKDIVNKVVELTSSQSDIQFLPRAQGDPAEVWSLPDAELLKLGWKARLSTSESIESHVKSFSNFR
jgi:UDP-glucose 4-epimerase